MADEKESELKWVLAPGEKPPKILFTRTTDLGLVIHEISGEGKPSQIIMKHSGLSGPASAGPVADKKDPE